MISRMEVLIVSTQKKKKKRKENHYIITISDNPKSATHARRHTYGLRHLLRLVATFIIVVVFVTVAGANYRGTILASKESSYKQTIESLTAENARLKEQNSTLSEKVLILSETVNHKSEEVSILAEKSVPTGFPLSVAADYEEKNEELRLDGEMVYRPMLEFTAPDGTYVVAAGDGTVSAVLEEISYGWEVKVDHGNGYVTSYRTNVEPKVKSGDKISRGVLLFEMKSDDDESPKMAYQIILNEEYINPTDVLEING